MTVTDLPTARTTVSCPPTAVVELAAFARGVDGVGRFLDVESDAEVVVAAAAGVPDRLLLRHGAPRCGETPGHRVVATLADLRAVSRAATVSAPVGVLLHVAPPARHADGGFDPYRAPFMDVLRTVVTSSRLHFDGLYLRIDGDQHAVLRACRFGVELAAALQQLPGFTVGELYVRRTGGSTTGSPDAASLAEAARREVRLHSAALGAVAPLLRVDAGPDAFPQCHTVVHRVIGVGGGVDIGTVRIDAMGDDLPVAVLGGTARLLSRATTAPDVTRAVTTCDGARTLGRVLLPADTAPGDHLALPLVGRTGLAAPSRCRLLGTDRTGARELLAGLGVAASRPARIAG